LYCAASFSQKLLKPDHLALETAPGLWLRRVCVRRVACGVRRLSRALLLKESGAGGRPEEHVDRDDGRILCNYCRHVNQLCYLASAARPHIRACPEHVAALGDVKVSSLKLMMRYTRADLRQLAIACTKIIDGAPTAHRPLPPPTPAAATTIRGQRGLVCLARVAPSPRAAASSSTTSSSSSSASTPAPSLSRLAPSHPPATNTTRPSVSALVSAAAAAAAAVFPAPFLRFPSPPTPPPPSAPPARAQEVEGGLPIAALLSRDEAAAGWCDEEDGVRGGGEMRERLFELCTPSAGFWPRGSPSRATRLLMGATLGWGGGERDKRGGGEEGRRAGAGVGDDGEGEGVVRGLAGEMLLDMTSFDYLATGGGAAIQKTQARSAASALLSSVRKHSAGYSSQNGGSARGGGAGSARGEGPGWLCEVCGDGGRLVLCDGCRSRCLPPCLCLCAPARVTAASARLMP